MASIRKEILIEARPEDIWAAVRDVGAVHTRRAPGVVIDTRLEANARIVTFANGVVLRELIVDVDDEAQRLVWAAVGGTIEHHNGAMQVISEGENRTRVVWTADLLPNGIAETAAAMMEQSISAMKRALDGSSRRRD